MQVVECEALLIATGRKPNVSNIGLERAGVEFSHKEGVKVNDYLQTTNKVCMYATASGEVTFTGRHGDGI